MKNTGLPKKPLKPIFWYWIVIPGSILLTGKILDILLNFRPLPGYLWLRLLAFSVLLLGVTLVELATRNLYKYGAGTPHRGSAPQRLVTEGVYRYCRHPMFFGYDLAGLGTIILLRSTGALFVSFPVYLWLQYRALKTKEEKRLLTKFGQQYEQYMKDVPRLIPNPVAVLKMKWRNV